MFQPITHSFWLTLILLVGAGAFWWWSTRYLQERVPVWVTRTIRVIRAVGLAALVLLVMNLRLDWNSRSAIPPTLGVYVDRSRSMDLYEDALSDSADRLINRLKENNLRISRWEFADTLAGTGVLDDADQGKPFTDLSLPLQDVIRHRSDRNYQGVVILSDGRHNRGTDPVSLAGEIGIPVYSMFIGDSTGRPDIALERGSLPNIVYVGDTVQVQGAIRVSGLGDSSSVQFTVRRGEQMIGESELQLTPGEYTRSVELPVHFTEPGEFQISMGTETDLEESNTTNNYLQRFVRVKPGRFQVTYLSPAPSFISRFLYQTFGALDRFSLEFHFTTLAGTEGIRDLLAASDLVYIEGIPEGVPDQLSAFPENDSLLGILSQADSEGNLWLPGDGEIEGSDWSEEMVGLGGGRPNPLASLEDPPVPWDQLAPVWQVRVSPEDRKSLGEPILAGPNGDNPVISLTSDGGTKFVFLTGRDFWRWDFAGQGTGETTGDVYRRTIEQLLYWLLQESETDRLQVRLFQENRAGIGAEAQLFDYALQPVDIARIWGEVIDSTGAVVYRASYTREEGSYYFNSTLREAGTYRLRTAAYTGSDTLIKTSRPVDFALPAYEDTSSGGDPEILKQISARTGGAFLQSSSGFPVGQYQDRPAIYKRESRTFHLRKLYPLLAVIVVMFAVDWWLRRRYGLL